ncbi:MAG: hypothetical protein M3Y58_09890 [Chloroflexota bacterium]|nr:hypothetical protein [Chloroflexota bacterium]
MAAKTEVTDRVERRLSGILAEVDWLPNTAAEWNELPDGERASISMDWDHLMADYLPEIHNAYHADQMTPDQRARYYELLHKLKDAQPIFERLNLYRPTIPLDIPSTTAAD